MTVSEDATTVTSREKSLPRSQNSSGRIGYIPIGENCPNRKTGLRGQKGMLFYGVVIFLFVVAMINLAVTVLLLSVLRIGYGMESMEFIRPGLLLRFLGSADMGVVVPHAGVIGGFADHDLDIVGESQPVLLQTTKDDGTRSGPAVEVGPDWTVISNVEEFRIRSPTSGQNVFSTKYDDFKLPAGVPHLSVKEAHVSKISSPSSESLEISSPYQTILKGNEGLSIEGREFSWVAGLDIYLKSVNQSVILDGSKGVSVSVKKLPVASGSQEGAPRWYKVCVCMPGGRVFRVPVRDRGYGCQDVRFPESINPCS